MQRDIAIKACVSEQHKSEAIYFLKAVGITLDSK